MAKADLVTDLRQAFVDVLAKHGKLYHFDDLAEDIINVAENEPTFSKDEASAVQQICDALHDGETLHLMALKKLGLD